MKSLLPCLLFGLLAACNSVGYQTVDDDNSAVADDDTPTATPTATPCVDVDGDGVCQAEDCDDFNSNISPLLPELPCDGLDNDCSPATDDGSDNDGDGYACDDCDDGNAGVHPGALELPCDGVDNDCNPITLDDPDNDNDGVGVCSDCDDLMATVYPGAVELCSNGLDDNCDTLVDCLDSACSNQPSCQTPENCSNGVDDDNDGLVDCADPDCASWPACAPPEICNNGIDDDLDGMVDCADADCLGDPACVQAGCPSGELITNGNFEQGSTVGWMSSSVLGWDVIVLNTTLPPRSGSYLAWLGGDYNEVSLLAQDITIPTGATVTLTYWYLLGTAETGLTAFDAGGMVVLDPVTNAQLAIVSLVDNTTPTAASWVPVTYSLSGFGGQSVRLQWEFTTDGSLNTNYFVDDVSVSCF